MSKFNTPTIGTKTVNKAGGAAFSQSAELELVSILLTSFANDTFYEKAEDKFDRMKNLLPHVDPLFAAKAAVYARKQFGMRSITHVLAGELAKLISGKQWAKNFYTQIVNRPDDMLEIISYMQAGKNKLPNSMKKGFAKAFDSLGAYELAKYRGEGKALKLVDVVNMVHPVPTEKNAEALKALVEGTLKSTDTWETKLTQAGQGKESEEEKIEAKKEAWTEMVNSGKLGYFALLRNLRNIMQADPSLEPKVIEQLTNKDKIRKSLVLPFRFFTAITELEKENTSRKIISAINTAAEISLSNVPSLPGRTLIAVDVSGSMIGRPSEIASMFGAVLFKATNSAMIIFSDNAKYMSLNPDDTLLSLSRGINFATGGTNFHSIFELATRANQKYDRIIILSDMQAWKSSSWGDNRTVQSSFLQYKQAMNVDSLLYSFDLAGYGSMQFPEKNVFCLAGFSDKIFSIMEVLEQDPNALANTISSVEL